MNKNIDAIGSDPTLDKEVIENIQLQINPPEAIARNNQALLSKFFEEKLI